jgi:hypothetical protein
MHVYTDLIMVLLAIGTRAFKKKKFAHLIFSLVVVITSFLSTVSLFKDVMPPKVRDLYVLPLPIKQLTIVNVKICIINIRP